MRVLLAAAPHADTFGYAMPPPGLLRLGGELLARGIQTRVEDLPHRLATGAISGERLADEATKLLLNGDDFELLGLSVMGATTPIALAIAERVRSARPDVPIVLGGPGTTGIDAALLERFASIDAVVRGEGEVSFPELIERWTIGRDLAGVNGVTWRRPDGSVAREADRAPIEDLSDLADYAWELFPPFADYARVAGGGEGLLPIDSGRGCAYDCSFCTIGRFWSRRSRVLPVERLLDEVAAVREIDGAHQAYLCHDLFGTPREHALAFCRGMHEREIDVPWECRARVDHLDEELIGAMASGGCYRVLLGIESGDLELRNAHDKAMRASADPLATVRLLAEHGITPILSFLLGLPGETETELRATLDLALECALVTGVNLSLHLPNPQPGCRLGEEHAESSEPLPGVPPDMAFGAGESQEERELIAAHPDLFSTWSLLTGTSGGREHVLRLAELSRELPTLLETRPRTFAVLARLCDQDALGLFDRLREADFDLDRVAAGTADPLARDTLAWELAIEEADHEPRVLELSSDPLAALAWMRSNAGRPPSYDEDEMLTISFAVLRGKRGTRTLRLTPQTARLITLAREDPRGFQSLAGEHAELLRPLQAEGLLPSS